MMFVNKLADPSVQSILFGVFLCACVSFLYGWFIAMRKTMKKG